jgi:UDP-N-acetylglucosamine:LPS N-acetylglucosamine transferase
MVGRTGALINSGRGPRRVLAVASGGGHWVQLLRLRPAFEGYEVTYVTVDRAYAADVPGARFRAIVDATRWNKLRLLRMALQITWILLRERPDVVISTGAAPGYFALRLGKWLGARTIWLDSIANVERLSLSGQRIGPHVDLWLTQWPHLARPDGPQFAGSVL